MTAEQSDTSAALVNDAGLVMMNGNLQDFVGAVSANGQIRYGDVRRLQRDILPSGIFSRDEAELLIALNAKLVRADKAWAQWLVAAVAEFVANGELSERPVKDVTAEWIGRLGAASPTRFGRSIAHKLRRALGPHHDAPSTDAAMASRKTAASCDLARSSPARARAAATKRDKRSPRLAKPQCAIRPRAIRDASPLAAAGFGWSLPGYWPAIRHGHMMNFASAPVGLVLAPCR